MGVAETDSTNSTEDYNSKSSGIHYFVNDEIEMKVVNNDHKFDEPKTPPAVTNDSDQNDHVSKAKSRWITVEPIMFLVAAGHGTLSTIRSQYLRQRISDDEYNFTYSHMHSNMSCITNSSDPGFITQQRIQEEASHWSLYLSVCGYLPLVFTSMIFGSWSDAVGRKLAMLIPLIGMILQSIMYLLVIAIRLPLVWLLIGEVGYGISGGTHLLMAISLSYLADVTTRKQRTFRVVVAETTLLLTFGGSHLAMGYLIAAAGFLQPFYIIIACEGAAIAYVLIPKMLYESVDLKKAKEVKSVPVTVRAKNLIRAVIDIFAYNVDCRRWRLLLLTIVFVLLIETHHGYVSVITLYVIGEPLCWSPILVGIYIAVALFVASIGSLIGSKLFGMFLSDIWLLYIALSSFLGELVTLGLAKTTAAIFVATAVGVFRGLGIPIVRSLTSKCVSPSEQGTLFSFLASLDSVAILLSPLLFQPLYAATVVRGEAGELFFIAGGFAATAGLCSAFLHWRFGFPKYNDLISEQIVYT